MKFHLFSFFLSLFVLTFSGNMNSTEMELRGTWTYNVEKGKFLLHGGTILNKDRNHASDSIKIEVWMYPHDFKTTIDSIQLISEVVAPVPRNFLSPKYELSGWFRSGYPLGNYSVKMRILEREGTGYLPRIYFTFSQKISVTENTAQVTFNKWGDHLAPLTLELDTARKIFHLGYLPGIRNSSGQVSTGRLFAGVLLYAVDQNNNTSDKPITLGTYELEPIRAQGVIRLGDSNGHALVVPYKTPPAGTYKAVLVFIEEQLDGTIKIVLSANTGQTFSF